ncbi:hypothetical protein Sango_1264800 [Sesamum angolense]|uniref:Retroviral polymerase SH3-like domain-containing protein n=1 Tax=Sesamum angolense TaxID=2727404 RepID=A0AAE2BUC3_9LAMI|nr:hypothetical protein Sango_1264800 [Sesamum angolense]
MKFQIEVKATHCCKFKEPGNKKSANVVHNDSSNCSDGDMLSVSTNQFLDAWILDSGYFYHITPNREYEKESNFLGTLYKNGFIPKADEDRETIEIVKGALIVIKGKIIAGNIYKLLGSTVVGGVHSVDSCDDNTKLWHMRLERMNKSLTERARCLRLKARLPKSIWAKAVSIACYLINRSPRASLGGKVTKEVWIDNPGDFDHLRVFGCSAYVHVPSDERSKLDPKSKHCIFLATRKFILQQHQDKMPKLGSNSNTLQMELEPHRVSTKNHGSSHPTSGDPVTIESGGSSNQKSGGSTTNELGDEPTTFHGAITSQEKKEWMGAMVEEKEYSQKKKLVQLPEGKKAVGCKSTTNGEFDMKDVGAATKILGIEIHRDRGSRKLWLSQRDYVAKVLDSHQNNPLVVGYLASEYAGDLDNRRSTTDRVLAVVEAAKEALWLNGLAKKLGVEQGGV